MERETGLEPATSSLGSWHSTTELLPLNSHPKYRTKGNLWAMAKSASLRTKILPPDVLLFILRDERQRIRVPGLKKGQHCTSHTHAVEIRVNSRLIPKLAAFTISLITTRIFL